MLLNRKMRILVVDDFSTMRRIVKNLLADLGFMNVDEADDGSTAWPMIQANDYGLIISDLNMPNMSGTELLKRLRSDEGLSKLPFLLITAEAKRKHFLEATQLGVNGYIVKPFTAETLNDRIEKIFEQLA